MGSEELERSNCGLLSLGRLGRFSYKSFTKFMPYLALQKAGILTNYPAGFSIYEINYEAFGLGIRVDGFWHSLSPG
jgi:hypothetical protein